MRALLRLTYYAVILGAGVDTFFLVWLLAEDRFGVAPGPARQAAGLAAVAVSAVAWLAATLIRSRWRQRVDAAKARLRTAASAAPAAPAPRLGPPVAAVATEGDTEDLLAARAEPEPTTTIVAPTSPADAPPAESLAGSVDVSRASFDEVVAAHGADDVRTLRAKAVLACAYWAGGQLNQATVLYEATVSDAERILGPDHLETLTWRSDLAAAYELDGRLDDAVRMYELALAGRERTLGANHPDTQLVRSNLAVATAVRANLARGRGASTPDTGR